MRTYLTLFGILLSTMLFSQSKLPVVFTNENVSTHFITKLNIDYTDLSTNNVVGDLPLPNILRIKPKTATDNLGIVTIVGESFFLQFRLRYTPDMDMADTEINLDNQEIFRYEVLAKNGELPIQPINNFKNPNYSLSLSELERYAIIMKKEQPSINNVVAKKYKMHMKLNNVWVVKDYIYVDYTTTNNANIPYSIDEIRYKIIDTKKVKATSSQDRLLLPDYVSNKETFVKNEFRCIAAFKKFTFPNDKSFVIEMVEDQISGRKITLQMAYSDILNAAALANTVAKNKTASKDAIVKTINKPAKSKI